MVTNPIQKVEIGSRQLSLFDNESEILDEQQRLKAFVAVFIERQGEVDARQVTEKACNNLGLAETAVWQQLFWLAKNLEICFRSESKTISPGNARKRLLEPDRPGVTIVLNRPVDAVVYQQALTLFVSLCAPEHNRVPPDQTTLARGLARLMRTWAGMLESCRPQAEQPGFPGQKEIDTGLALIAKLSEKLDAYSFLHVCCEKSDEIVQLSKTAHRLKDFYTRHADLWQRLLDFARAAGNTPAESENTPDVDTALVQFNRILHSERPYNRVTQAHALMRALKSHHDKILARQTSRCREKALAALARLIDRMTAHLRRHAASEDSCNHCLYPLHRQGRAIRAARTIEQINRHLQIAQESFKDSWHSILPDA